jgi:hypothetical protein
MPGMFDPSALQSDPEVIATYKNDQIGNFLREGLTEKYPTTTIEVQTVERQGHQVFEMVVRTDPITACEMKAFVGGFFRAYNNRHKLG